MKRKIIQKLLPNRFNFLMLYQFSSNLIQYPSQERGFLLHLQGKGVSYFRFHLLFQSIRVPRPFRILIFLHPFCGLLYHLGFPIGNLPDRFFCLLDKHSRRFLLPHHSILLFDNTRDDKNLYIIKKMFKNPCIISC